MFFPCQYIFDLLFTPILPSYYITVLFPRKSLIILRNYRLLYRIEDYILKYYETVSVQKSKYAQYHIYFDDTRFYTYMLPILI